MSFLQEVLVAAITAFLSGSITGLVAVLKMRDSITELKTLVTSTVEFRLSSLESRVSSLEKSQ